MKYLGIALLIFVGFFVYWIFEHLTMPMPQRHDLGPEYVASLEKSKKDADKRADDERRRKIRQVWLPLWMLVVAVMFVVYAVVIISQEKH